MGFLQRLFGSKKQEQPGPEPDETPFKGVHSRASFESRYREEQIAPQMLEGCLKMVESYFYDNKLQRKHQHPVNHPENLDQLDQEGFGFMLYCQAFNTGETQALLYVALAFSAYLIDKYGFKLYKDSQPEEPLRSMTLKYDHNNVVLSLYPFEYASKVFNGNETFAGLESRLSTELGKLPDMEQRVDNFLAPGDQD